MSLKDIVSKSLAETITVIQKARQHLLFAGALGVLYRYDLTTDILQTMHGHSGSIDQIEQVGDDFLITGSADFSCRLWDLRTGVQLFIFLDINCQNSRIQALVSLS